MYGLKDVRHRRSDSLSRVGWDQLESLLAIYYRGKGYRVDYVGTGANSGRFDGGIDLKLHKDNEYIVLQCKHWNAKQVPHNDVHQLLGIMVNECATGAILVSSGEFTAYARESAAKQGKVQLIDGDALREMIGPLPEPPAFAPVVADKAGAIVAQVGDRLLSAAEDRIRGNRGGQHRGGKVIATAGSLFLAKVVLPLAFAGVMFFLATSLIKRSITGLQAPKVVPVTEASPLPVPTATPFQAITSMPAPSGVPASARTGSNPCHEVIDWQSGTYIDHCMRSKPAKPLSAAERRELTRKADEAMRVIQATTPEF